jgi:RNA polymerase sigma factor (sigma-70 family)
MTQEEYGRVYQEAYAKTVRVLRSRGASCAAAEDTAQTAWLQGWKKLHQLRDKSAMVGWINRIALNFYFRSRAREARYGPLLDYKDCGTTSINTVAFDVSTILSSCPSRDRNLFELHLNGLSNAEIAIHQGVSATAIRIRLHRARQSVRGRLEVGPLVRSHNSMFAKCS